MLFAKMAFASPLSSLSLLYSSAPYSDLLRAVGVMLAIIQIFPVKLIDEGNDLLAKPFQLAGLGHERGNGRSRFGWGKLAVHGMDNLIIVVRYALKLIVKIAQSAVKIDRTPVNFYHFQFSAEDPGEDKATRIILATGLGKHRLEPTVLGLAHADRVTDCFRI